MYEWRDGATGSKGEKSLKYNREANLEQKERLPFHPDRRNEGVEWEQMPTHLGGTYERVSWKDLTVDLHFLMKYHLMSERGCADVGHFKTSQSSA